MQLIEGNIFDNRYCLRSLLGRGGFSEVWLVEDTKVGNKKMALKIYAPGMGLDDDGVRLFSSEFELVYDLNHSHLLKPSHFDVCERSPYLVLPYCENGSATKNTGNMPENEAWNFLHDVASGLAYLHEQREPIIHQDIKPDNILIDNNEKYLITDFGISAKARSTLRRSVGETKSGGTIAYMPPERFGKDNTPIKASDVWALGATLFELLTGDVPFGEHGGLVQKGGAEIPEIGNEYSKNLQNLVQKMLAPEPWDRPRARQIVELTERREKGDGGYIKEPKKDDFDVIIGQKPKGKGKKIIALAAAGVAAIVLLVIFGLPMLEKFKTPKATYLTTDPTSISLSASGDTQEIEINTDAASFEIEYPSWCIVTDETGTSFKVSTEANTGTSERQGQIRIDAGGLVARIDVSQAQKTASQLTTSPNSLSFGAPGGTQTLTVSTDGMSYDVSNLPAWCSVANKTDASFEIVCQANTDAARSGSFKVQADELEISITVSQESPAPAWRTSAQDRARRCPIRFPNEDFFVSSISVQNNGVVVRVKFPSVSEFSITDAKRNEYRTTVRQLMTTWKREFNMPSGTTITAMAFDQADGDRNELFRITI